MDNDDFDDDPWNRVHYDGFPLTWKFEHRYLYRRVESLTGGGFVALGQYLHSPRTPVIVTLSFPCDLPIRHFRTTEPFGTEERPFPGEIVATTLSLGATCRASDWLSPVLVMQRDVDILRRFYAGAQSVFQPHTVNGFRPEDPKVIIEGRIIAMVINHHDDMIVHHSIVDLVPEFESMAVQMAEARSRQKIPSE